MTTAILTDTAMRIERSCVLHDITPLMVWLSPSFPVGSYAYSHGLEWAVEIGDIEHLASLEAWLTALLEHGGPWSDSVLLALAYKAVGANDDIKLRDIAELAAALTPSKERKMETMSQGAAFLAAVRNAWPCPAFDSTKAFENKIAFPVAVGLAAAGHSLPLGMTIEAYLVSLATNLISAAVRLIPLGQTDGTKAVAKLVPITRKIARRAVCATVDEIGGAAFRSDIASMRHETQYTRLFRS